MVRRDLLWQLKVRIGLAVFAGLYALIVLRLHHQLAFQYDSRESNGTSNSKTLSQIKISTSNSVGVTASRADFAARPSPSYQIDLSDLWETPTTANDDLPNWMKDYFRWHKEERQHLMQNPNTWSNSPPRHGYLLVVCLASFPKCGGFADRLMSLPFLVKVAAQSRRLLFIKWGRPVELEDLLLPPTGGVDWRVPPWLFQKLELVGERVGTQDGLLQLAPMENVTALLVKLQSHDHGETYYDQTTIQKIPATTVLNEPSFQKVFRSCWHVIFTVTTPIAQRIEQFLQEHKLIPGFYASTHLRALYSVKELDPNFVKFLTRNAINCTSQQQRGMDALQQGGPILFASDSAYATKVALEYGASNNVRVISQQHEQQQDPLHLDKTTDWKSRQPLDFYDTVVDLYLLSMSSCVTYGMGGYGKLASYLSRNASCSMQHHNATTATNCFLAPASARRNNIIPLDGQLKKPLFLSPMPSSVDGTGVDPEEDEPVHPASAGNSLDEEHLTEVEPMKFPDRLSFEGNTEVSLWEQSTKMPQWMKDYFNWHHQQREQLTAENWGESRYLVMVCLKRDYTCGGTADRLRPLPVVIRIAAETRRILFIKWERPAALESFLLPPIGGIDWRTPKWLVRKLHANSERALNIKNLVRFANDSNMTIVKSKLQASDYGSKYYNSQGRKLGEPEDAMRQHYRDCWFTLFTPVPAIASIIEAEMQRMHLFPGEFSYAHLRAQYGVEERGREPALIKEWTINSLNCLSHLRPGGPFFFASDSAYARHVAVEYGNLMNTSIVTRIEAKDPLHIDIVTDGEPLNLVEYYPPFIDVYIMSFGVCMTYNMGGFGKWGQLLSGRNFECNVRHWTAGVAKAAAEKSGCKWRPLASPRNHTASKTERKLQLPLFLPPMPQ